MNGHESWAELAAGYALQSLEPDDEERFLVHLRACAPCERLLAELRGVAGHLAYAAEPVAPPARGLPRLRAALPRSAVSRPVSAGVDPARSAWRPHLDARLVGRAAAVVALLGLGLWNLGLRADLDVKRAALARRQAALSCMNASGAVHAVLSSAGATRGSACLSADRAYLVVDGLERNRPAESTYVLWWADRSGVLRGLYAFDVTDEGINVFAAPHRLRTGDVVALAISKEPGRRIPQRPSGSIARGTVRE